MGCQIVRNRDDLKHRNRPIHNTVDGEKSEDETAGSNQVSFRISHAILARVGVQNVFSYLYRFSPVYFWIW